MMIKEIVFVTPNKITFYDSLSSLILYLINTIYVLLLIPKRFSEKSKHYIPKLDY